MSNFYIVLGYINNVLTGTLTGSSSSTGLGVDQLQNDQGNASFAWQTTSAASATLTVVSPSGSKWRGFGLFRTNLTTAATVGVVVRNGGSGGTIVYSGSLAAVVAGYGQMVAVATAEVTGDWCQFSISDAANPDGFFNIPLAFAGPLFQPARNYNNSSSFGRASQTTKAITRSGGAIIRNDWNKRICDLNFSSIKASEVPTINAIDLAGRQGNNILFVPDPTASTISQDAIFGEFEPTSGLSYPFSVPDARGYRATVTERL